MGFYRVISYALLQQMNSFLALLELAGVLRLGELLYFGDVLLYFIKPKERKNMEG